LIIHDSCSERLQPNIPAFPSLTDGPHPRLKLSTEAKAALIYWQRIDLSEHKVAHLNWRVESMDLLFVLLKPKGNHETHETTVVAVVALFPSYFVSSFPENQNLET